VDGRVKIISITKMMTIGNIGQTEKKIGSEEMLSFSSNHGVREREKETESEVTDNITGSE